MAIKVTLQDIEPQIGKEVFLADGVILVGDVEIGEQSSIWYNTVLRGDVNPIRIGHRSNVQDNVVIHTSNGISVTTIGNFVSIGHAAIIHGAIIEDNTLIGMGAILMDNVHVGEGAVIAAGAVVLSDTTIPPYTMWAGCPAKLIKSLDPEKSKKNNRTNAENYVKYSREYLKSKTFSKLI